jgi:hypothetical protein
MRRYHLDEPRVQRAFSAALKAAGIAKVGSVHTVVIALRHIS